MTATGPQLHTVEISARPRRTWSQALNGILFIIVFDLGCLTISFFQFTCLVPLRLVPFGFARRMYDAGVQDSKGAFVTLLLIVCQCFAPTKLVVTFEADGVGKFSPAELQNLVSRNDKGDLYLNLPAKSVLIANHQVYADWMYAWCLTYFMNTHRNVFIVLKNSLKWIPLVGWGMQIYNFIFLARSWASDRLYLSAQLSWLGQRAEDQDIPLTLILYPEGTLVSKNTRPISKKFADKEGIPDMVHTLLPRSTGLHYSLRSLASRVPDLKIIDITMSYPGIPPLKYGQSYYTLRSIFFDRVPPPSVHMHIRCFDVLRDVPLGDMGTTSLDASRNKSKAETVESDIPQVEKDRFEEWLRRLWREKDILMTKFLQMGSFVDDANTELVIPLKMRHNWEVLNAFCFVVPAISRSIWSSIRNSSKSR